MKQPSAALTDLLTGQLRAHHRRLRAFGDQDWQRYGDLLHGVFLLAVQRRFTPGADRAAIIRFVASVRERYDRTGYDIEPGLAEELVRAALEDRAAVDGPEPVPVSAAAVAARTLLVVGLLEDEGMPEAELVEFLDAATAATDRPTADRSTGTAAGPVRDATGTS
ncbi:hypothetical protein [Micromonospora echinofusca]|uniref:Uncharacterized protein n=1 Tax=Micromonospora echinofusca TaxID=47858 RepID=A0ABS3VSF5_MICEH|nr:hypothetical protein [Micromonospora echinofusca]MBO4207460.1 hypothetical protein [Micromonospora echinofusca]